VKKTLLEKNIFIIIIYFLLILYMDAGIRFGWYFRYAEFVEIYIYICKILLITAIHRCEHSIISKVFVISRQNFTLKKSFKASIFFLKHKRSIATYSPTFSFLKFSFWTEFRGVRAGFCYILPGFKQGGLQSLWPHSPSSLGSLTLTSGWIVTSFVVLMKKWCGVPFPASLILIGVMSMG